MAEEYSQVVGTVPDSKAYTKTRRDERFILTEQKNIELDSQDSYVVLDSMEAGTLQSIKITVDNPYAQVLLQIDEYRNKDPDGQCAAEILYNGNSDNTNRNFKVLDGQSSSKGYTLEYKPDQPEDYNKRLRIVVKNSIKASRSVYGMGLNYTSGGSLPTPAVPSHMAGGTFSHPAFKALSLSQIARAMTKPVGVSGYASNSVFNESAIMNDDIELGSDHPFEGIAGTPTFKRDVSSHAIMETGYVVQLPGGFSEQLSFNSTANYRLRVLDEPEQFPGSSSSPSQMIVEIAPQVQNLGHAATSNLIAGFAAAPWYGLETIRKSDLMSAGPFGDTWPGTSTYTPFTGSTTGDATTNSLSGAELPAAESIIGKRMFIRRGGTIYFPGVVKTVTKSLPSFSMSTVSAVDETQGYGRSLDPNNANKFASGGDTSFFGVGVYPVGSTAHGPDTGGSGASSQATTDNGIIVMPYFTGQETASLDGVVVGGAAPITLDQTKVSVQCDTNTSTTIDGFTGSPASNGILDGMNIAFGDDIDQVNVRVNGVAGSSITITNAASGGSTAVRDFYFDRLLVPRHDSNGNGTYEVYQVPHTPWVYTFTFEPGVTESPIDFATLYDNEDDNHYLSGPALPSGGAALGTVNASTGVYANTNNSVNTGATNSRGLFPTSESNCWGTVTSQADTNPKVLIKSIEVKRNKRVSYEG